jgi:hypothetical protein
MSAFCWINREDFFVCCKNAKDFVISFHPAQNEYHLISAIIESWKPLWLEFAKISESVWQQNCNDANFRLFLDQIPKTLRLIFEKKKN